MLKGKGCNKNKGYEQQHSTYRGLRQWCARQRDGGETDYEESALFFCAKVTVHMIMKRVQTADNIEILVFRKSR